MQFNSGGVYDWQFYTVRDRDFFWKRLKKDDGNQKKETVQEQEWRGQERLPEIPRGSGRGGHLLRDVPTAVADQWCWSLGVSVGGI